MTTDSGEERPVADPWVGEPFRFDLIGVGLDLALAVAFSCGHKVAGWRCDPGRDRLVLFWTLGGPPGDVHAFPSPLGAEEVQPMVSSWLHSVDYGSEPRHDGSNRKGWRVFNEKYGHVNGWWGAFIGIEPVWLEFHK